VKKEPKIVNNIGNKPLTFKQRIKKLKIKMRAKLICYFQLRLNLLLAQGLIYSGYEPVALKTTVGMKRVGPGNDKKVKQIQKKVFRTQEILLWLIGE
jgi:hypothetical protein